MFPCFAFRSSACCRERPRTSYLDDVLSVTFFALMKILMWADVWPISPPTPLTPPTPHPISTAPSQQHNEAHPPQMRDNTVKLPTDTMQRGRWKCFDMWVSAVNQLISIRQSEEKNICLWWFNRTFKCCLFTTGLKTDGTCCQLYEINSLFIYLSIFLFIFFVRGGGVYMQMTAYISCDLNSHFSLLSVSQCFCPSIPVI